MRDKVIGWGIGGAQRFLVRHGLVDASLAQMQDEAQLRGVNSVSSQQCVCEQAQMQEAQLREATVRRGWRGDGASCSN